MPITLPTSLPRPLQAGYQIQPQDQVARTDMDAGNQRARRRTTARRDVLPLSWVLTHTQASALRTWFDDPAQADGGAAWVDMALDMGTGTATLVQAQFTKPPQFQKSGPRLWVVTAEVVVRDHA